VLFYLSFFLKHYWSVFNTLHYVSVRAIASLLSSLFLSILFGKKFIEKSKKIFQSNSKKWIPKNHALKKGMPTMGGLFMIVIIIINSLLWCNLLKPHVWIFLFCLTGFGIIGSWDDWHKIKYHRGISAKTKLYLQIIVAIAVVLMWIASGISTTVVVPLFKNIQPDLGIFFIPWAVFILVGCSNAVNLTDGLDGLAIGSLIPNIAVFSLICYATGHYSIAHYLHIPFTDSSEITILGAIMVGTSLGFLWYNAHPAQIFMGDVGSLSLGASLAFMALISKQELLLPISGGIFVFETLSVILQVVSLKWFNKRIFKMAPIHHHFELLGWQESKITTRLCIISVVLSLLALVTLKIR